MVTGKIDARTAWNAVERLVSDGHPRLAADLAALLYEPSVHAALVALANGTGYTSGLRLAQDAALEALETA